MRVLRRDLLGLLAAGTTLAGQPATGLAQERLKVVASFSILGDMVQEIGGERIDLATLVGPDGDAHVYQPSPADARAVAEADLVIVNGLGFEGWLDRLVAASGYRGPIIVASEGVATLSFADGHAEEEQGEEHAADAHDHEERAEHAAEPEEHEHAPGTIDPHAWQSVANAVIYARNIADALAKADPANAAGYLNDGNRYRAGLEALDAEVRAAWSAIPGARRRVITSHDAFGYYASAYDVAFLAPVGLSTDAEPSAGEVAALIRQIREAAVPAIFVENVTDPRLVEQIARETGARIGGTLYSDALSRVGGPASTYVEMIRYNTRTLTGAINA